MVRTAVGGDLNAETHSWRQERNARCTPSDTHLEEMMEESDLTALAEGSTHRSGTQIDNWLMTPAAAREMGASWVMPGVCGKDHEIVVVGKSTTEEDRGERRPTNSAAKAFFPESKDPESRGLEDKGVRGRGGAPVPGRGREARRGARRREGGVGRH